MRKDVNVLLLAGALLLWLPAAGLAQSPAPLRTLEEGDTLVIGSEVIAIESSPLQRIEPVSLVGPPSGTLVLVGGGAVEAAVWKALAAEIGGWDAPIVVIPTADCRASDDMIGTRETRLLTAAGFTRLEVLHTRDRSLADSGAFASPLAKARAVWLSGGGMECLLAPYLDSAVHEALRGVLARGGVVAGTSAGAIALADYVEIRIGSPARGRIESRGFGLLRSAVLAAHVKADSQAFSDLSSVVADYFPGLLGIGLAEGAAAFVRGDRLEVSFGPVVIVDQTAASRGLPRERWLGAGAVYELDTRRPIPSPPAAGPKDGSASD